MSRREEIIQIAARLFKEKGYHAATLQDIADELQLSKPALYYHIKSKEDVLCEICNRGISAAIEGLQAILASGATPQEKFRSILKNHIQVAMNHLEAMAVTYHEVPALPPEEYRRFAEQLVRYQSLIEGVYREGVESGVFRPIDPALAVNGVLGMVNWLYRWYDPNGAWSPEEISAVLVEIAEGGICK